MLSGKLSLVLGSLLQAEVRFLVVGGLAVVAHGFARATLDCDLVIDLEEKNVLAALGVLNRLGYAPRVPVGPLDFANVQLRKFWREEKHMVAFTLIHPDRQFPDVDLFTQMPFDFEEESDRATEFEVGPELWVPVVSLDALVEMKQRAGRPKDALDVAALRQIRENLE